MTPIAVVMMLALTSVVPIVRAEELGDRIIVAGVTIHLESADCASGDDRRPRRSLIVNLGQRRSLALTDVLESLAARARRAGVDAVSTVRLDMRGSGRKSRMVATAMACANQSITPALPIDPGLVSIVQAAASARIYRIAYEDLRTLNLDELARRPSYRIDEASRLAGMKSVLLAAETYDPPPDIQKACPFWPNLAVLLDAGDGRLVWVIIAQACQNVRFVAPGGNWRTAKTLNVTKVAQDELLSLISPP
jgi:hypothetical protein